MVTKAHVCWRSHSHETHTERKREWEKKKFHWICHWLMNFGKEFKMKFTQIRTNFYRHITLYACSCVDVCLSISTKLMIQLKWMDGWLADWLTGSCDISSFDIRIPMIFRISIAPDADAAPATTTHIRALTQWVPFVNYQRTSKTEMFTHGLNEKKNKINWDKLTKVFDEVSLSQKIFPKDFHISAISLWYEFMELWRRKKTNELTNEN